MDYVDIDHALVAIGKKLEKDPDDWEAWAAKADLLFFTGLYESAIRCCNRSLQLNPDNAFAWNTKGNALDKLGMHEEAYTCHNRAKELESCFSYKG